MLTNFFSVFDPTSSSYISLNWVSSMLFMYLFPLNLWTQPSRMISNFFYLMIYLFKDFSYILKKPKSILVISITYFMCIMFNNTTGLMPYIFTSSSHMVFTLSLALTLWLSLMNYGWLNNSSNLLAHLIPQGTPTILMPFMVLIETISNMIRPGTLAIRLMANMVAGHLLMVLLSNSLMMSSMPIFPIIFTSQILLSVLESAVSFIQAYVFSVLITIYMTEFMN